MAIDINPIREGRDLFTSQTKGTVIRCAIGDFALNSASTTSGTTDYGSQNPYNFGTSTDFDGFLLPEPTYGEWDTNTTTVSIGGVGPHGVYSTSTGTVSAIQRERFFLNYALPVGTLVSSCKISTLKFNVSSADVTSIGVLASSSTGATSGLTGTVSVTLNFGVIEADNTKTQLGTGTQSITLSDTGKKELLGVTATNSTVTKEGDRLYVEIVCTLDQTARTSGAAAVGCGFYGLGVPSNRAWSPIEFTIE